jgi:hypothetical protein
MKSLYPEENIGDLSVSQENNHQNVFLVEIGGEEVPHPIVDNPGHRHGYHDI